MKSLLARWDVTADEQARLSFAQVLTTVNLRRVEIACIVGLFTRLIEMASGFRSPSAGFEIPFLILMLIASEGLRRRNVSPWLARGFVAAFLVVALLGTQWSVAAMGAYGRLTSAYPLMLLSLALLFVLPPRIVAVALGLLYGFYCLIVLSTPTQANEQTVAMVNTAIVSVIAVVAAALIYAGRRSDHQQKLEIRKQNDALLDRSIELDSLMAITVHDLRSPLHGMRNLFDLAVQRAPQEPDLPLVAVQAAIPSIDAMLALATRLMDAHAAEHRALADIGEHDVRGHVLAAIDRAGPLAQSGGIEIVVDLPNHPLIAFLDVNALGQILDNLLSNGVRFSPAGGAVTISAGSEAAGVAIRILDQGPGVAPARLSALFKKFQVEGHTGIGSGPGMGMGLFIVSTLAQRIAANVRHEQPNDGGACFIVTLATRDRS